MKKIILITIILSFFFLPTAFSSETDDLESAVDEQLGILDSKEFDKFLSGIDDEYVGDRLKDYVRKIIDGESVFSIVDFANILFNGLFDEILGVLPICVSIILICVLSSTLTRFSSKLAQNSTQKIIRFVTVCVVLVLLLSATLSYSKEVITTINSLKTLANVVFPILVTLLTVIGGGRSVGVFSPYIAILSTFILNGVEVVIIPLFFATIALSVVGNITDSVKLDKLRGFFTSTGKWVLGLVFGLFTTFLTGQALVSSTLDSVSIKATKFALSSYVPILGGYLSEGFDFVMAGSVLIKNAVGLTSIIVLGIVILLPLIKLVVFSLALKLTSGIVESFGDSSISKMVGGISSSINILTAVLLGVGFIFFFVIMLVIFTVNVGVV